MQWSILAGLLVVCLVRCSEGGVFTFQDASRTIENDEKVPKRPELKSGKVCLRGSTWTSQCSQCQCLETGYPDCTFKNCSSQNIAEKEPLVLCAPDTEWINDCNTCRCTANGQPMCTRMECVSNTSDQEFLDQLKRQNAVGADTRVRKTRGVTQELQKTCQPGQEFRMDCNKCLCDNEGQNFSCTRNDCNVPNHNGVSRTKRDTSEKVTTECVPESVFDKDCNVCRCNKDGQSAMCTTKRCQTQREHELDTEAHKKGRFGRWIPLQPWRAIQAQLQ